MQCFVLGLDSTRVVTGYSEPRDTPLIQLQYVYRRQCRFHTGALDSGDNKALYTGVYRLSPLTKFIDMHLS